MYRKMKDKVFEFCFNRRQNRLLKRRGRFEVKEIAIDLYYGSWSYKLSSLVRLYLIKKALDRDKIIYVDGRHRFIGKTTVLVDRAVKIGAPILTSKDVEVRNIASISANPKVICITTSNQLHNEIISNYAYYSNGILIDDTFDNRLLEILLENSENIRIRGGFRYPPE